MGLDRGNDQGTQKGPEMRLDWNAIWEEFDIWFSEEEAGRTRPPNWGEQVRAVQRIVSRKIGEKLKKR
jgi:hypothetical protein